MSDAQFDYLPADHQPGSSWVLATDLQHDLPKVDPVGGRIRPRRTSTEPVRAANGSRPPGKLQIVAAVLILLLPAILLFVICRRSPNIAFVFNDENASWIMYPTEISAKAQFANVRAIPIARFVKTFRQELEPRDVELHVEALRNVHIYVNDAQVPLGEPPGRNWKREIRIDISRYIQHGQNTITAEVRNLTGPQLLYLYVQGLGERVSTDETWQVRIDSGPTRQAILADDTRTHPDSQILQTPWQSASRYRSRLLFLFLFSIALFLMTAFPYVRRKATPHLHQTALVLLSLIWSFLFVRVLIKAPVLMGYDITGHLGYITYILQNKSLPLASDGWCMYHPPLFYVLSALTLKALDHIHSAGATLADVRVLSFLSNLGNVWISYALAKKIFMNDPVKTFLAVVVAAVIPMNLYMTSYISNESLHGFLAGLSILLTVHILSEAESRWKKMLALGCVLGLALLTKFTTLVLVPVIVAFVAFKMLFVENVSRRKTAAFIGLLLASVLLVSGWFYARNIIHFGRPLVGGWDLPGAENIVLQQPGFHTPGYYFGFGEVFSRPYFSGFHSFWDAIYSTLWGDGYVGGVTSLASRNITWNYDYMSIGYLLSLPATVIAILGVLKGTHLALRGPDIVSRTVIAFLMTAIVMMGYSMLYFSLTVPAYSTVKAFFALSLMGPLSVLSALGVTELSKAFRFSHALVFRAVFFGWFGTWAAVIYLSFAA